MSSNPNRQKSIFYKNDTEKSVFVYHLHFAGLPYITNVDVVDAIVTTNINYDVSAIVNYHYPYLKHHKSLPKSKYSILFSMVKCMKVIS